MCFYSKQTKKAQEVQNRFHAKIESIDLFSTSENYNGFTFPKTPIITNKDNSLIQMVNWGLVPNWANSDWNKIYTLNARFETLNEKPSFKNIIQNRCIVIVNGFYEWQHQGKTKIKYEIGFNDSLYSFAGLYDENNGLKTYTIVTTEAKGIMKEIHNSKLRMPISLKTDEQMKNWLNGNDEFGSWDFTAKPLDPIQKTLF